MFRATAEAKGEGYDPVKHESLPVIYYWPFQDSSSAVVLHSCACVYLWYASNVATFTTDHFASFLTENR